MSRGVRDHPASVINLPISVSGIPSRLEEVCLTHETTLCLHAVSFTWKHAAIKQMVPWTNPSNSSSETKQMDIFINADMIVSTCIGDFAQCSLLLYSVYLALLCCITLFNKTVLATTTVNSRSLFLAKTQSSHVFLYILTTFSL